MFGWLKRLFTSEPKGGIKELELVRNKVEKAPAKSPKKPTTNKKTTTKNIKKKPEKKTKASTKKPKSPTKKTTKKKSEKKADKTVTVDLPANTIAVGFEEDLPANNEPYIEDGYEVIVVENPNEELLKEKELVEKMLEASVAEYQKLSIDEGDNSVVVVNDEPTEQINTKPKKPKKKKAPKAEVNEEKGVNKDEV